MKHKKVVLAYIEKLAGEMGAAEPEVLAHQLGLLIDGAIVAAMVSPRSRRRRHRGPRRLLAVPAVEAEEAEARRGASGGAGSRSDEVFATVIASQRIGAKRRPMTGSAKQSIAQQKGRVDCFVASLLAMTGLD